MAKKIFKTLLEDSFVQDVETAKLNSETALQDISELVSGQNFKGNWNVSTNSPTLTSTPSLNGDYYIISVEGTSSITGTSILMQAGGRVISNGTNWVYQAPVDSPIFTDIKTTIKGLYTYNSNNTIDTNIANAIKQIHFEIKQQYVNDFLSIRYFGYESNNAGLIIQIYNVTTSTTIYTIKLSNDTTKPSTVKRYSVHLPDEYYIDIIVDWTSFTSNFLQSTIYSIKIANLLYDSNRKSIKQFTNNISYFEINGIDEKINYAIKDLTFEHVNSTNEFAVYGLGWDGTAVYLKIRNKTLSSNFIVLLESGSAKPSGIKNYIIHSPYIYYINVTVDWDTYPTQNLISSFYTVNIITKNYDINRLYPSQLNNGINSFNKNGTDERIAYAIKYIKFEYLDGNTSFAVKQIGWNGTFVVLILRNLILNQDLLIKLSNDSAKPTTGLKYYSLNKTNEYNLEILIDWSSFPSQSILSSTFTTILQSYPYQFEKSNNLVNVDYNTENLNLNSSKKYIDGVLNFELYPLETGTLSSGQDAINGNRIRTKYSIRIKPGSTVTYNIQPGYRVLLNQVNTYGVKSFVSLFDNGILTGNGSVVLNTNTESIRMAFSKLLPDNVTETLISESEVNSINFSMTTSYAQIEPTNQAITFTDDQLTNRFIRELYIEGLDKTQSYTVSHIRRNVNGSWRFYIKNKITNIVVFQFGTPSTDFQEKGIFDRTLSGVRVRAVFDWSVLPILYHNLDPSIKINLNSDRIFDIKFSPTIMSYYNNITVRGNKLLSNRVVNAIDNNYLANENISSEEHIVTFMNSKKADEVKAETRIIYDTIAYSKNGSIALEIDGKLYEFCQERDTDIYDNTSNIYVRVIDIANKVLLDKTRILGFGDLINGVEMTKIPYVYSGVKIDSNTIRIYIRVQLNSNINKFGYIDYSILTKSFSQWSDLTLNGNIFNISTYYSYIRDNVDFTLTSGYGNLNVAMSLGKHIMKHGSYYYALIGSAVGLNPYNGTYYSLAKSLNGIDWEIFYTFSDFKNGQDDADMYIKDGILYAQLRQTFGTLSSVIVVFDLTTNKEITNQIVKSATCRGEFFEHDNNLYLFLNTDENRQYAKLFKVVYNSSYQSLELYTVIRTIQWNANWSIHSYNSKIYVLFGVEIWEAKINEYNGGVAYKLYELLK